MITADLELQRSRTSPQLSKMAPVPLNFQQFTTVRDKTNMNELKWLEQVKTDLKLNSNQVKLSDKHILSGKINDTMTNLREMLARLSNDEALKYTRQCRLIVAKLRKCWVDLNDEMKSLSKTKAHVESAIDHVRKDLQINQDTFEGRIHRAQLEIVSRFVSVLDYQVKHTRICEADDDVCLLACLFVVQQSKTPDTVDDILVNEKQNLLAYKKNLEFVLKIVQEHLLVLARFFCMICLRFEQTFCRQLSI